MKKTWLKAKLVSFFIISLMITSIFTGVVVADETTNDTNANNEALKDTPLGKKDTPLGKIVFTSDRSGNPDIWIMNDDGSDVTRLTDNPATDCSPKWSHGGTKIAFASNRGGTWHIWIMNADGSNQWQLTSTPVGEPGAVSPAWYPDDQKIAFTANNGHSIYSINIDGSGLTEIIPPQGSPWPAPVSLDISPDGSKFALVMKFSNWGHDREIFTADIDGSNLAQLTSTSGWWEESQFPAWSPNGNKILFEGIRAWDDNHRNLYTMNPDGSDQIKITSFTTTSPAQSKKSVIF